MTSHGGTHEQGPPSAPAAGLAGAVALLRDALAGTDRVDLGAEPDAAILDALTALEVEALRLDAQRVGLLGEIDRRGLHLADGHATAKVMVRNRCRLSGPEAARRARVEQVMRRLPLIAEAYRAGSIGADQVNLIARVNANPRLRELLVGFQEELLVLARECDFPDFEIVVRQWERLADADGPEPRADRGHGRRSARMRQNPDLSWTLAATFGALQGARINNVLRAFTQREFLDDCTTARAERGGHSILPLDLARTHAQRAADGLERICDRAAAQSDDAPSPVTEHLIVWDADTYLASVHRIACHDPGCRVEAHDRPNRWYDPATYVCRTYDGQPLEPVEAVIDSFTSHVRTVLVTNGVPTEVGSRQRLFRGKNRLAAKIQSPTCIWPGCWVTVSDCEVDHTRPRGEGGPTRPDNGAPLCGRHNRWKQKGYTTGRDPDTGRWRTNRPDGTEIP